MAETIAPALAMDATPTPALLPWTRDYRANDAISHPWILRALRLPFKVIGGCEDPVPMMVRYRIGELPWGTINLHHFLRGDHDRALHDHPFGFVSLVLAGGYIECLPTSGQGEPVSFNASGMPLVHHHLRLPGDLLIRPARWTHRVEMLRGRTAWTLIWMTRKTREWGFFTGAGWMPWRRYHETAGCAGEES